ncbi:MAG: PleD family two-component system response regulator [Alphaproteobacteria bacterium]|nr:PleD family two-component system response regulator [Alphaproteobacteria bacterium]
MPARVLVVDDILPNVKVLEAKLSAEYFDVTTAMSGKEALEAVARSAPDIVLLDVMMPEMDGFEVARRIKGESATAHIPIVMVTALSEPAERVRGLEAGADDFLIKPVNDLQLFARVRSLVRLKQTMDELRLREETSTQLGVLDSLPVSDEPSTVQVLVVEDSDAGAIAGALRDIAHVKVESDPQRALEFAGQGELNLIIVSLRLRGADGLRLCSQLRTMPSTKHSVVLAMIEQSDTPQLVRALEMGVAHYIVKPLDRAELIARARSQIRRKRYQDRLRLSYQMSIAMAVTDPLTGLHNRRYLTGHLDNLIGRSNAGGKPTSLMMLDIDFFKKINDTWGHASGDDVLKEFANRLRRGLRGIDLAGRFGGEEFVVAMPATDAEATQMVAERLRKFIAEEPFPIQNGAQSIAVTASIRVTTSRPPADKSSEMLERADQALYAAKRGGRNKVVADVAVKAPA